MPVVIWPIPDCNDAAPAATSFDPSDNSVADFTVPLMSEPSISVFAECKPDLICDKPFVAEPSPEVTSDNCCLTYSALIFSPTGWVTDITFSTLLIDLRFCVT